MTVEQICRLFGIPGELVAEKKLSAGNINLTCTALFRDENGAETRYVVQRINGFVFKQPTQIMSNIEKVTAHIRTRLEAQGADADRLVLQFLHIASGANFWQDEEGNVWRVYYFIPNSVAVDATEDPAILRGAGSAFGQFQKFLLDFDAAQLFETIPDFHNTPKRLDRLFADVAEDPCGRAAECRDLIDYISEKRELAGSLIRAVEAGELPLRVTHNDTKCNNVLFDGTTGEPLAVIDLDTIMPGLMAYDFGDAVRFAASTAAEDEPDTSKVALDLNKFRAFAEGFVGALGDTMTDAELDSLSVGAFAITIELASRFLDDYLTGDRYFAVKRPNHNLERTACQIALAKDMERKLDEMKSIIREIAKK